MHLPKILIVAGLVASMLTITVACNHNAPNSESVFSRPEEQNLAPKWIVSGNQAKDLLTQGASLLDARQCKLIPCQRLPGSVAIAWQEFSQSSFPHQGKLPSDDQELTQKLQKLGIDKNRAVVVIGNPQQGWGEEGRIVWMLRTLGHNQAVFVDGGYKALIASGVKEVSQPPQKGDFVVQRRGDWQIEREELKNKLGQDNLVLIDSRSEAEYAGKILYGEARGGHVPGAVNLHYRDLLDEQGKLLARRDIMAKLQAKGITPKSQIVSYCTGGVRSAWLTVVLSDLGLQAKNYPGSMWEWSASSQDNYPLDSRL